MESPDQNNFENIAENAEEKLERISSEMDTAMIELPKERFNEIAEKLTLEKVEEVCDILTKEMLEVRGTMGFDDSLLSFKNQINRSLGGFPPVLMERFIHTFLMRKEWAFVVTTGGSSEIFLEIMNTFKNSLRVFRENESMEGNENIPIEPIVLSFEQNEFSSLPSRLGAALSDDIIVVLRGNIGFKIGNGMTNGKLIVEGDVGKLAGARMTGGILDIRGDVKSFDPTAFFPKNQGTIIWRGIKIFEKGKKTEKYDIMNVKIFPFN